MRSYASAPLAIPPAAISGSAPPVARRKSPRRASASAFSGAPERPPVSPAKRDRSGGRETVVLPTMSASIRPAVPPRDGVDVGGLEVGRHLQEQGRPDLAPRLPHRLEQRLERGRVLERT